MSCSPCGCAYKPKETGSASNNNNNAPTKDLSSSNSRSYGCSVQKDSISSCSSKAKEDVSANSSNVSVKDDKKKQEIDQTTTTPPLWTRKPDWREFFGV